jgi:tetratricopeptide (TPR) repeat protein
LTDQNLDALIAEGRRLAQRALRSDGSVGALADAFRCLGHLFNVNAEILHYVGGTGEVGYLTDMLDNIAAVIALIDRLSALPNLPASAREMFVGNLSLMAETIGIVGDATGDLRAVVQAVNLARRISAEMPEDHPERSRHRLRLAENLHKLHAATGDTVPLEEAVELARRELPDPDAHRSLAVFLHERFRVTSDPGDLDEGERQAGVAIARGTDEQAGRARYTLAALLMVRYAEVDPGRRSDIDRAVDLLEEPPRAEPTEAFALPGRLRNLAMAYSSRYRFGGHDPADLERAVRAGRASVAALERRSKQPMDMHDHLLGFASLLLDQHQATGDPEPRAEGLAVVDRALATAPATGAARVSLLAGRSALLLSSLKAGDADPRSTLDQAVAALEEAAEAVPEGYLDAPNMYFVLAMALSQRCEMRARQGDLPGAKSDADRAVERMHRAIGLCSARPELRARLQGGLAVSLLRHALLAGEPAGSDSFGQARELARTAAQGAQVRPLTRLTLGFVLAAAPREGVAEAAADREEAVRLLREGGADPGVTLHVRAKAHQMHGRVLAEQHPVEALAAYERAVELLPLVAPRQLRREAAEMFLGDFADLPADAAACALLAGRPERAAELLEQGRGVLLAQTMDVRSELAGVPEELRDRFLALREALDPESSFTAVGDPAAATLAAEQRARLSEQWEQTLARIRAVPGFDGMLRPLRLPELLAETREGPVVVVNVSRLRSDALLLTEGGVRAVPLPGVTPERAGELAEAFRASVHGAQEPELTVRQRRSHGADASRALADLWTEVVAPVLDALDPVEGPPPRLWWSATGALSGLPLHAAQPLEGGDSALDRVVSSYTPTVRVLRHARRRAAAGSATGRTEARTLVVAVPGGGEPGDRGLPGAAEEAALVGALLGDACEVLSGDRATRGRVERELPGASRVHFACHARGSADRLPSSELILTDSSLTLRQISALDLRRARLAVLSACGTAVGQASLANEAVHLTGAFLVAGYPEVVGTLWEIVDTIPGAILAGHVHRAPGAAGAAAAAVRAASLDLRERFPRTPTLWAAQIHVGC